jgi:predicted nucleic acid-binding protein
VASYFFDSSAIVKRYVAELGSAWVQSITVRRAGNDLILARITHVEVLAALVRHRPALAPADLALAVTAFEKDCRQRRFRFVAITKDLITLAGTLAARHRLRGYDAIQLACLLKAFTQNRARGLPKPMLISADHDLNNAATLEGFAVDDPNNHP